MADTLDGDVIDYATPGRTSLDLPASALRRAGLQVAHRALSLGLVLLIAGVGACAAGKAGAPLLLWGFASGDVALLGAVIALASERRRGLAGREPLVAACVSAGVALVALVLYLIFRAARGG